MIEQPTVFIIGAGASAEYGFPLGQGLVARILALMSQPNTPLLRAINLAGLDPRGTSLFHDQLLGSDADSIDTFLEGNDEAFVQIGKAAIAYVILEAESRCVRERLLIESAPDDHWLRYVWNSMRAGSSATTLASNRVTFVTFNYDRAIEAYFQRVISSSFQLPASEAESLRASALPIIHLHGEIAEAAFGYFEEGATVGSLTRYAAGIRVVHDSVLDGDKAFEATRLALKEAKRICFLGFGYHPVNIRRLDVDQHAGRDAHIFGSTYRMGRAEIDRARRLLHRTLQGVNSAYKCEQFLREEVLLL
jgi:hypothetical protein